MADLGEVIGSFLVSLVHARRKADEETAAVAEYYRQHPLLEGMSLPRIRIPEISIDMPLTIDSLDHGEEGEVNNPNMISRSLMQELQKLKQDEKSLAMSPGFDRTFNRSLLQQLSKLQQAQKTKSQAVSREAVARAVDNAITEAIKKDDTRLTTEHKKALQSRLRMRATEISLKKIPKPSSIAATFTSSDVKEKSSPMSSIRLKITLREEGLEWSKTENDDGSIQHTLQPE
jgi:hypothetical protein